MSLLTDPNSASNEVSMSSEYDIAFEPSDMESFGSSISTDENIPKDYWFGIKYFECIIAQTVLQRTCLLETVARVDSELEQTKRIFPYAKSLPELKSKGLDSLLPICNDSLDSYSTLMFCIGAVVRCGNRRQKATLLAVIRQHSTEPSTNKISGHHTKDAYSTLEQSHLLRNTTRSTLDERLDTDGPGRYATMLKEYADKHGLVPVYVVAELSNVPPLFGATVTLDGSSFEGRGKQKKEARHQAAKAACTVLELGI